MTDQERLERVADALRKADAEQRGLSLNLLLPFGMLSRPESTRWLELAKAGIAAMSA